MIDRFSKYLHIRVKYFLIIYVHVCINLLYLVECPLKNNKSMTKLSFEDLNNKVCVITGGGGVIGKALALGLGAVGVKTALLDLFLVVAFPLSVASNCSLWSLTYLHKSFIFGYL
jgi:hypothetical protein